MRLSLRGAPSALGSSRREDGDRMRAIWRKLCRALLQFGNGPGDRATAAAGDSLAGSDTKRQNVGALAIQRGSTRAVRPRRLRERRSWPRGDRRRTWVELNDIDRVARAGDVDAHAAGEFVAADDGMNGVAGRCPAHTARRIISGLAPGAGDLAAAIIELGAGIELDSRCRAQRMFWETALPATL